MWVAALAQPTTQMTASATTHRATPNPGVPPPARHRLPTGAPRPRLIVGTESRPAMWPCDTGTTTHHAAPTMRAVRHRPMVRPRHGCGPAMGAATCAEARVGCPAMGQAGRLDPGPNPRRRGRPGTAWSRPEPGRREAARGSPGKVQRRGESSRAHMRAHARAYRLPGAVAQDSPRPRTRRIVRRGARAPHIARAQSAGARSKALTERRFRHGRRGRWNGRDGLKRTGHLARCPYPNLRSGTYGTVK